ncbi:DUF1573 domain-containing protein [Adhaeribacter aquaticus]|uniref:DUF1573 domain-containing protein n=1 Tax=Adhaeribacter aquaticus TaxID=299567 RepID=UPI000411C8DE|nr:DUF1573 domain-containing protein [Adhaeribacter aquaticus]
MIKNLFLSLICFCLAAFTNSLFAQGKLQFEKETHDFGNIAQGVPATYEFKFKNVGNQPVIISNVQASCGCTTPEWTKTPILPGKTGSVKAQYNAASMGAFNKSVTVTSNASNSSLVLFIKGTVLDKSQVKSSASAVQKAQIQFEKETFDFGNVAQGVPATHEFKFKNTGGEPLVISNVQASCGCTTPEWTNTPILPGKTGSVKAQYNAASMGAFNKSITVTSNATNSSVVLYIKGTVVEKSQIKAAVSPEEKANSPRATLKVNSHDLGKLETGQKSVAKIVIKNTGKQDLTLNAVSSSCNCVSLKNSPVIKPGNEEIVELTYSPRLLGNQTEKVKIHTNDIITPEVAINLNAKVVENLSAQSILKVNSNAVPFK